MDTYLYDQAKLAAYAGIEEEKLTPCIFMPYYSLMSNYEYGIDWVYNSV